MRDQSQHDMQACDARLSKIGLERTDLMFEFAPKSTRIKVAFLDADPHPMQLPLEAIPQKHSCAPINVTDVLGVLCGKQLLLQALFEGAITAATFLQGD